jgi:hypothetical protein
MKFRSSKFVVAGDHVLNVAHIVYLRRAELLDGGYVLMPGGCELALLGDEYNALRDALLGVHSDQQRAALEADHAES